MGLGTTTSTTPSRPSKWKLESTEKLSTIPSTTSGIDLHSQDSPLTMSTHAHPFHLQQRTRRLRRLGSPPTTLESLESPVLDSLPFSILSTRSSPTKLRLSRKSSSKESTSSSKKLLRGERNLPSHSSERER